MREYALRHAPFLLSLAIHRYHHVRVAAHERRSETGVSVGALVDVDPDNWLCPDRGLPAKLAKIFGGLTPSLFLAVAFRSPAERDNA